MRRPAPCDADCSDFSTPLPRTTYPGDAIDLGITPSTLYIDPGAPWQNGFAESFHGKLRDELLDAELFGCLKQAKILSTQ